MLKSVFIPVTYFSASSHLQALPKQIYDNTQSYDKLPDAFFTIMKLCILKYLLTLHEIDTMFINYIIC